MHVSKVPWLPFPQPTAALEDVLEWEGASPLAPKCTPTHPVPFQAAVTFVTCAWVSCGVLHEMLLPYEAPSTCSSAVATSQNIRAAQLLRETFKNRFGTNRCRLYEQVKGKLGRKTYLQGPAARRDCALLLGRDLTGRSALEAEGEMDREARYVGASHIAIWNHQPNCDLVLRIIILKQIKN